MDIKNMGAVELKELIDELGYDLSDLEDIEILAKCTGTCERCQNTCTTCQNGNQWPIFGLLKGKK